MLSEEGTQCAQHTRLPQLKTEVRVTDIFCHLYEVLLIGPPKTLYAKNGRKRSFQLLWMPASALEEILYNCY